jgi:replicative DNA helicase
MASEIKELKAQVSLLTVVGKDVSKFERRNNEYWACCPLTPEKTPSFSIKVKDGEEVFFCHGCGKGGDVLSYIEYKESCSRPDAVKILKSYAVNPRMTATFARNAASANDIARVAETFTNLSDLKEKVVLPIDKWPAKESALLASKSALAWLLEKRGITEDTAKKMRLGFSQSTKGHVDDENIRGAGWILFPRFNDDKVIAVKMRSIAEKAFSQVPGMDAKALFNADAPNALEDLFVTEGELDTCIFEQADFRAVSIPNANSKLTPEGKAIMKRASRVFLAGDNDGGVGNAAMRALLRELGENAYIIEWPGAKDANQFFLEVCKRDVNEFRKRVEALVEKALSTPVQGFTSLLERLKQAAAGGGINISSDPTRLHFPFQSLDNMSYAMPGSVVTFYSTYSGTGKTVFATQVMLREAERGETVVVYSPEVRDQQYLALVAAQTLGMSRLPKGLDRAEDISEKILEETYDALSAPNEKGVKIQYYVGHSLPVSDGEKVIDFLHIVARATGATRLVIDTLHRIVTPAGRESQIEAEGRMMRELESLAIEHQLVVIIIGQSNKEAEDLKEVRKDAHGTLRGNREITDISDSVYLIHRKRNEKAEQEQREGVDLLDNETTVVLVKGRVQGKTGKYTKLVYKKECSRFFPLTAPAESAKMQPTASSDQNQPPEEMY